MAINYNLQPNESIEAYNSRIATERGDTSEELASTQKNISQETVNQYKTPSVPETITGANLATTPLPPVSEPSAPGILDAYQQSLAKSVEISRTALETTYQKQLEDTRKKTEDTNNKIADFTSRQKGIVEGEAQTLLQPFREQLETAERERLYITENFEANQALTRELDTLLTEGNALINAERARPAATSIVVARTNKAIEDVVGRSSVIQAVMSARNNQIAVAQNFIDRSVQAINADRNDRLNYLNTLFEFYENQKDEEGIKLATLTKEEKGVIQSQINLIERDLEQAETNANYIKELLSDQDTAMFAANAGVSLNKSPEENNRLIAAQSERQLVEDTKNEFVSKGYQYVPFPTDTTGLASQVISGKTYYFRPPLGTTTSDRPVVTLTGKPLTDAQATSLGFARRLFDADKIIDEIGDQFTGLLSYAGGLLPNILKTKERQSFEQAQRNFINAVLRKESGAAISPSEFDSAAKQYFPQPGDGASVLLQKSANRQRAIENLALSANVNLSTVTGSQSGLTYEDYLKAIQ